MFLHLGGETIIPLKDVVAITDMRTTKKGEINREFLTIIKEEELIKDISEGMPKSFVVTTKYVYLSAISPITLKRRASFIKENLDDLL